MNNALTFRSTKITYYGPHPCSQCGVPIAKMAQGFGGSAFTYPSGPIYPNTEWHVHVCNPIDILAKKAEYAMSRVLSKHPRAKAIVSSSQGWFISSDSDSFLSGDCTFFDSDAAAWIAAKAKVFPSEGECDGAAEVIRDLEQPRKNERPQ